MLTDQVKAHIDAHVRRTMKDLTEEYIGEIRHIVANEAHQAGADGARNQFEAMRRGERECLVSSAADSSGTSRVEPIEAGLTELVIPSLAEQIESLLVAIPEGTEVNISIKRHDTNGGAY